MKLFLSVGHARLKNGAATSADGTRFGGVNEYEYNKNLLVPLVNHLIGGGHEVDAILCPEGVFTTSKEEREYKLPLANAKPYDLILELHLNAVDNPHVHGFEVLYKTEKGKRYARPVADCLSALFTPRGEQGLVKRDDLYMLNETKAPAILLETFFCTNIKDCFIGKNTDQVAACIAAGLNRAAGLSATQNSMESGGNMDKEEFIQYVGSIAEKDWKERKICIPSLVIAQAMKESGFGTSELAIKAKALFGIKKNGWKGKTYVKDAIEQNPDGSYRVDKNTEWRAYDSWEQSILDHNDYIARRKIGNQARPNWEKVIGCKDYKQAVENLQSAQYPYATDRAYGESLIKDYILPYGLDRFDKMDTSTEGYMVRIGPFVCLAEAETFAGHFLNAHVIKGE
ncbi:hypothetical protein D7X25_28150 [bacterium 1XD42-8]|nr:hypothetical protein [Lachnospiraceae bacterium]RKJ41575.1 hypothetical protein D7X25_28150 [bacterium 1XD42-8]